MMPTVTSCQDLNPQLCNCGVWPESRFSAQRNGELDADRASTGAEEMANFEGSARQAEKQLDRPAALVGVGSRWARASASLLRVRRSLPSSILTCASRTGLPNGCAKGGSGSARARVVGSDWTPVLGWTADEGLGCDLCARVSAATSSHQCGKKPVEPKPPTFRVLPCANGARYKYSTSGVYWPVLN
jgi:hypothetical protein